MADFIKRQISVKGRQIVISVPGDPMPHPLTVFNANLTKNWQPGICLFQEVPLGLSCFWRSNTWRYWLPASLPPPSPSLSPHPPTLPQYFSFFVTLAVYPKIIILIASVELEHIRWYKLFFKSNLWTICVYDQNVIGFLWHSSLTVTFTSFWLGIRSFPGHFYFWTVLELKVPQWLTFQCLQRLHSLPFTGVLFALRGLYKLITWKILFWFSISLFSELLSFYTNSAEEKQDRIENIKPPWFCFLFREGISIL